MAITLFQFTRNYIVDRARFVEGLRDPVLVWQGPPRRDSEDGDGSWASTASGGSSDRPADGETLICPVVKGKERSNAFAMGITVGRVGTNDIVVADASVGRFHAFFQRDEKKGTWSVSDADSQNGTFVGPNRLRANTRQALADGEQVRFGEVTMRFYLPAGFIRYLDGLR